MSPNALRLLGKVHRYQQYLTFERLCFYARGQFDEQNVAEVVDELVHTGYLLPVTCFAEMRWLRTKKPYTDSLRFQLAAIAQRRQRAKRERAAGEQKPVNKPVLADPVIAAWFGICTVPVYLVGRVHYTEDTDD